MFKRTIISAVLLGLSSSASADFESAMEAYQKRDYAAAAKEFRALAELGEQSSQLNLGVMYYKGEGFAVDRIEAFGWLSLAAEDGHEQASRMRDSIFSKLSDAEKKRAQARAAALVADFGTVAVKRRLLPELMDADNYWESVKPIKRREPEFPREAAMKRLNGMVAIVFRVDETGAVRDAKVEQSLPAKVFDKASLKAIKRWQFEPATEGLDKLWHRVVIQYDIKGERASIVDTSKLAELKRLAEQGYPAAQFSYAQALMMPAIAEQERQENPGTWFTKAAQGGLADAQYRVGSDLLVGAGCKSDREKGIAWLELAAQAGNIDAQYDLAQVMLHLRNKPEEREKAWNWLETAAKAGHELAKRDLAWLLVTGADAAKRDAQRAQRLADAPWAEDEESPESLEVLAAIQAERGDFGAARKLQKTAISEAQDRDWSLAPLQARLAAYEAGKPWRE